MASSIHSFSIAGSVLGVDEPPYCIAEVGINHNGKLSLAKLMIEEAKKAGADAVKFQTFRAEEFCGDPNQMYTYQSQGVKVTESMLAMFKRYEFSVGDWYEIRNHCDKIGITFFSTPQNVTDLDLLCKIGVPAVKVGSDDFTNLPLIQHYSRSGLPLILSSGMSDVAEIHQALEAAGWFNGSPVAILLCTSQYPTPPEDVNISKLTTLQATFPGLLVGFSDHTQGTLAASLAASHGARIFEKHFTLDKSLPGPDHWFSEDPAGLSRWVADIHTACVMLGDPLLRPTARELEMRLIARRSIVAVVDITRGERLTSRNVSARRPGGGLPPTLMDRVIGLSAGRDIKAGERLSIGDMTA